MSAPLNSLSQASVNTTDSNTLYNPYDPSFKEAQLEPTKDVETLDFSPPNYPTHRESIHSVEEPSSRVSNLYWGMSSILGFKERLSLVLFVIFAGAMVGFCIARTEMLNPKNVHNRTVPGEWFWYRQSLYFPNILLHIYLSMLGGFFAVFQFVPAVRRRYMVLHRINGYLILLCLIPGMISGAIVGRRAFGGSPSTQFAYYMSAMMTIVAACLGIGNVKNTRVHRKWMLRMVSYVSIAITARVISIIARELLSIQGNYHEQWTCAELSFLQTNGQGVADFLQTYPMCGNTTVDPSNIRTLIQVQTHALPANYGSSVRATFGMGLWIALVLHVIGVELYINATDEANQHRRGFVLGPDKTADDH